MVKKPKIQTPDWILEGKNPPKTNKKGKLFKIRRCPKCNSDKVSVVIGELGFWECKKCKWKGKTPKEEELDEDCFMKFLDERGNL
ncbi:hypothetical protein COU58_02135 [Candidatus Pacearchaeota archaeon CG10_big_fil_rev_8_21_14_0_10_32_42]|nr:MAG: hypothetical protein COU58_02135 [Candidatus Pacearchaeota archaeon CG10_big_fil_rev_8_21_14_0_10_32_42]